MVIPVASPNEESAPNQHATDSVIGRAFQDVVVRAWHSKGVEKRMEQITSYFAYFIQSTVNKRCFERASWCQRDERTVNKR
ncbi:MAG: hypothetical protein KatS3mg105_1092 [Gemmatales bacterium]|nr:MAG: hypothetical protein KatS3mg105_1092 [Gemmatales bacterium]